MSKNMPQRKRLRLKEYDYSQEGYYFITICTQERKNILSYVGADSISARIVLTKVGKMIEEKYLEIEKKYPNIKLHEYIIMPNHIHGIIEIKRADIESAPTLSNIIQNFKRHTTIEYIKGVKNKKYNPFDKKIWQRNYYEHIIRNEKEYWKIIEYIRYNPENWKRDSLYN